jgi:hypothetical protein
VWREAIVRGAGAIHAIWWFADVLFEWTAVSQMVSFELSEGDYTATFMARDVRTGKNSSDGAT